MNITSQIAHEKYKPKKQNDHNLILSVLSKDKSKTYKEIGYEIYTKLLLSKDNKKRLQAYTWKFDPNKVSRRLKELVVNHKIKVLEIRKCTMAKSLCNAYVIV